MEVYDIRPGDGIGPVRLGQSRPDVRWAMEETGRRVTSFVRWPKTPPVLAMDDHAFQVYFGESDTVEEIEIMGSGWDAQERGEEPPFIASYEGVDVFRTPATEVEAHVSQHAAADKSHPDHGPSLTFPTLGLALWRDGNRSSRGGWSTFFMTALVCPPEAA